MGPIRPTTPGANRHPCRRSSASRWGGPTRVTNSWWTCLPGARFVSHRFAFQNIVDAYDTFGRAAETKALKVVITR